ncbi:MAG: hypothetical protein Q7U78_01850 [Gallionella sp.]|nr:hypothetical protein [Gallionella sp.]
MQVKLLFQYLAKPKNIWIAASALPIRNDSEDAGLLCGYAASQGRMAVIAKPEWLWRSSM